MENMTSLFKRLGIEVSDEPMSDEEFRRFVVDCYNDTEGDLDKEDGIQCDICKNKGWIQVLEKDHEPHRRCKCMAKRAAFNKAKSSGLGKYLKKTLDDYEDLGAEWRKKCRRVVEGYLGKHSEDDVWFIACGQNGSGKTLLGSIIANTILKDTGRAVTYIVWTDFIGQVKRDMMGEKSNEVSIQMEDVKNAEVLFLDEVFKEFNATDKKYLAEIINYRYTNDMKTIITSEKLLMELIDIDEATFGRAIEKCEGFMINIPRDKKKDWRLRSLNL